MLDTQQISDSYIAELPYLLGYEPTNSVVAIWLHEDLTMSFAQRGDISDVENDVSYFVSVGAHNPRSAALILIYSDNNPSQLWDLGIKIGDTAEEHGITVHDILKVNGQEYSTFFIPKDQLDNQETVTIDSDTLLKAQKKYEKTTILSDRDSLMSMYECLSATYPFFDYQMTQILTLDEATSDFLNIYSTYPTFAIVDLAPLSTYLHNIEIRDEVLLMINSLDGEGIDRALTIASSVLGVTPRKYSTPLYTVTGIMAWLKGNGALANMLIERALEVTPDYRLAILIKAALSAGMNPSLWREVLDEI